MMPAPACVNCIHWKKGTQTCAAFVSKIPDEIWFDGADHRVPWPGDEGIMFEVVPGEEELVALVQADTPIGWKPPKERDGVHP